MRANSLEELNKYAAERGIPLNGMFEITQRCNLRCNFCYVCNRATDLEKNTEKAADEWLHIIHEAVEAGMLLCTFTGGEPFLRGDFEEIYCKAYDMGLRISIFTNAILIGEKHRAYLRKRPPGLISVSLYGASEASYRTLCGDGDGFEKTIASIDALQAAGLPLEIKTLALRPLLSELEAIGRIAMAHKCHGKIDVYLGPGRDDPNRHTDCWRIPMNQLGSAIRAFQKGTGMSGQPRPPEHTAAGKAIPAIPCQAGRSNFFITHDGRMLGCSTLTCFATHPFASGFSPAWTALHAQVTQAEPCLECGCCPDMHACYLCPANRMKETGSIAQCSGYLKELAHVLALCGQMV